MPVNDTVDEGSGEHFLLQLSGNSRPSEIDDAEGIGWIVDDDGPPKLSAIDGQVIEEPHGSKKVSLDVWLPRTVSISLAVYEEVTAGTLESHEVETKLGSVGFPPNTSGGASGHLHDER